jgi:predicted small lipoprotein YifL
MKNLGNTAVILAAAGLLTLGLTACEKKGPVEQAAEEVDEAVDTVKRGEESTANKVDDAVDELRE